MVGKVDRKRRKVRTSFMIDTPLIDGIAFSTISEGTTSMSSD